MIGKPRTRIYKNRWFAEFHLAAPGMVMAAPIHGSLSADGLPHVRS